MNDKTKKLLITSGIVIGILILIIIILSIISNNKNKAVSYEEFEDLLYKSTELYYKDNPKKLPTEDGEYVLSYSTLESAGYIKSINKLLNKACSAEVKVIKYSDYYSYIPYIDCGDEYKTIELYKTILNNNTVVESDAGFYKVNDEYIYRGEVSNNYIALDEELYRIVRITSDNEIEVVKNESLDFEYLYDNRYNVDLKGNYGINEFELSRIKDSLKELSTSSELISDKTKSKLVAKNICIGKKSMDSTDSTNIEECSVMSEDKYYVSLLTVSEYLRASLDDNCNNITNKACMNYNYLSTLGTSLSLTALNTNTYDVFYITKTGIKTTESSDRKDILPVLYISSSAIYASGNGTKSNPYIIK